MTLMSSNKDSFDGAPDPAQALYEDEEKLPRGPDRWEETSGKPIQREIPFPGMAGGVTGTPKKLNFYLFIF